MSGRWTTTNQWSGYPWKVGRWLRWRHALDRLGMEAEDIGQQRRRGVVARFEVEPHVAVYGGCATG